MKKIIAVAIALVMCLSTVICLSFVMTDKGVAAKGELVYLSGDGSGSGAAAKAGQTRTGAQKRD